MSDSAKSMTSDMPGVPALYRRAAAVLVALCASGCGDSGVPLFPVTGRITLDDVPFVRQTATVVLKPVGEKQTEFEPVGKIDFQGNYEVFTGSRKGAPAGRYKVVVTAHDEVMDLEKKRSKRPLPNSLLPAKYASAATTDLVLEVVERPADGAYDLKLESEATKKEKPATKRQ